MSLKQRLPFTVFRASNNLIILESDDSRERFELEPYNMDWRFINAASHGKSFLDLEIIYRVPEAGPPRIDGVKEPTDGWICPPLRGPICRFHDFIIRSLIAAGHIDGEAEHHVAKR